MTTDDSRLNKYEILRHLARSGTAGERPEPTLETALQLTAGLLGLAAAAVFLWNEAFEVHSRQVFASQDDYREKLLSFENDLLASLRKDRRLTKAHLTFAESPPIHLFSVPLLKGPNVFGAVVGLQEGEGTVVSEDDFLETLAAAVTLYALVGDLLPGRQVSPESLEKERMSAVVETAVTVNHEINNPLTAILGNIQLLLMKSEELDEATRRKLKIVEESALKIRDVTQRLLRIKDARSTQYVKGTNMIQLPEDNEGEG
jgi:signal transduction histidine kinase